MDCSKGLAVNPEPAGEWWPRCPVCGEETDTFFRNKYFDIIGCDECLKTVDAWDWAVNVNV